MTAGDLYPFVEYSIHQVDSQGKIQTYVANRELLLDMCIHSKPGVDVNQKKQRLLSFLASHEACYLWEEEEDRHQEPQIDSLYITSAGYKAIILREKMLLVHSGPLMENNGGVMDENNSFAYFMSSSFYIMFVRLCLAEYRNKLSVETAQWQAFQRELDMHCAQISAALGCHDKRSTTKTAMLLGNNNTTSTDDGATSRLSLLFLLQELAERKQQWSDYHPLVEQALLRREFYVNTRLIVYSFVWNIFLCAVLIGSTSANSFGTNLNIPLYQDSAHGPKAALWYIVSGFAICCCIVVMFWFFRRNKAVGIYCRRDNDDASY